MRTLLKRHVTHEDQRLKSVKLAVCPFGIITFCVKKRKEEEKNKQEKTHDII